MKRFIKIIKTIVIIPFILFFAIVLIFSIIFASIVSLLLYLIIGKKLYTSFKKDQAAYFMEGINK